jgi:hypothetical protein
MKVTAAIKVGNMTLVERVDLEPGAINEPHDNDLHSVREIWEMFVAGDLEAIQSYQWRYGGDEWMALAMEETATITFGKSPSLKVGVPLVLFKAELRRIIEEHDAEVAAKAAAEIEN